MVIRTDTPVIILLFLGLALSVLTVVFPGPSGFAYPGILLAYPAYWALNIRHALAVRLYRRQALGIGLVSITYGLLFVLFTIVNVLPPGSCSVPSSLFCASLGLVQPPLTDFVFLTTFYWVDSSVLAGRRSDPLLRDTFGWGKIRLIVWGGLLFSAVLLIIFSYSSGYQISPPILVLPVLLVVVFVPLVSGSVLLPVVARRSGDSSLRKHLQSFALFLATLVVLTVLFQFFSASAPTGLALLGLSLVGDMILLVGAYFLYLSARSLAPLNRLSLSSSE